MDEIYPFISTAFLGMPFNSTENQKIRGVLILLFAVREVFAFNVVYILFYGVLNLVVHVEVAA